jgi:hypothetical protein
MRGGTAGGAAAAGAGVRPLAKSLMRAYAAVEERVRETAAEARESLEDLYAEVRAERDTAEEPGEGGEAAAEGGEAGTDGKARARRRRVKAAKA